MAKTSWQVKERYNAKNYKEYRAKIKIDLWEALQTAGTDENASNAALLELMYYCYQDKKGQNPQWIADTLADICSRKNYKKAKEATESIS